MISELILEAKYTVVFSGAGMSTESGIPDYRSTQGLWHDMDPMKIASTYALKHNRQKFSEFFRERAKNLLTRRPNRGHEILASWEQQGLVKSIITQNIDGLHTIAGSRNVIELHGTLSHFYCMNCYHEYSAAEVVQRRDTKCICGSFIRPDVVLFGEQLNSKKLNEAEQEACRADLFIVLGSSLQVSPANMFPQIAKAHGAKLVIINLEPTELDYLADMVVNEQKIAKYLGEIDRLLHSANEK